MAEGAETTLGDLLRAARVALAEAGIDDPALESRILIEHFTGTTRAHAITAPRRPIAAETVAEVGAALARRAAGEPIYRIIGVRSFYGLDLRLSPETLDPRPDTETLVDAMLPFVRATAARTGNCRILDLGTGTGAVALALLSQVEGATATAVDLSAGALATAASNATALGLDGRFFPVLSDWFSALSGTWDAIVSNPPYIPSDGIAGLDVEVRLFDPAMALDGGPDGLDAYRRIAAGAADHLCSAGQVAVEIGYDQKKTVREVFEACGYRLLAARRDLVGSDRVLVFELARQADERAGA